MFSRSRTVAPYSSRLKRRIGYGPGTGPFWQAAARNAGIKILPYFYIHGVDTTGEAAIFNSVLNTIGADGVVFQPAAQEKIRVFTEQGFDKLPVCMAKTHLSLSHDPTLLNAPTGFTVTVRDIRAYTGSGWLVPLLGDMQTMPGLGVKPAAFDVDIDESGRLCGAIAFCVH